MTFPAAGVYTVVAAVSSTASFPAFTSLPLTVTVGATGVAGVYPTTLALSVPASSPASPVNATVTLSGSTYAPTGRIVVNDSQGNEVGRVTFFGAVVSNPITIPLQLPTGSSTLTAIYNGDDQNQSSTLPTASITVGNIAKVTPAIAVSVPASAIAASTISGVLSFSSTSTTAPTGNITVFETPTAGSGVVIIATIPASQTVAAGGVAFTFIAPAAGTYNIYASYDGDSAYNLAFSPTYLLTTTTPVVKGTVAFGLSISTAGTSGTQLVGTVTTSVTGNTSTPTATYLGDTNFTASSSNIMTLVVTTPGPTTTTTEISSLSNVTVATSFTATVSLIPKTTPPTAPTGSYTLTATYAGDANYGPSNSSIGVTVNPISTDLQLSNPGPQIAGTPFKLYVQYASSPGYAGNMTLSIQLNVSQAPVITTVPFQSNIPVLLTSAGTYTVIVSYARDILNSASTSKAVNLVVSNPVTGSTFFTMTLDDPNLQFSFLKATIQVNPGIVATTGVTLTSFGGYNTPVNLPSLFNDGNGTGGSATSGYGVTFKDSNGTLITAAVPTVAGAKVTVVFTQLVTTPYVGKVEVPGQPGPNGNLASKTSSPSLSLD